MAFHIEASHLPRIYGYNHAKEVFNKIEPIRGGDQSVRRIGKRNDATKWLKHEIRDGVDVYIAGLHYTGVVTFYPSHYEIYMCGWNTMSTQIFIHAITGNHCYNVRKSDLVPSGFHVDLPADVWYDGKPMDSSERYKFDYEDNPLQEMPKVVKYRVNRKRMNEVRKIAKPFYQYMETMHNITPIDDIQEMGRWAHMSLDLFKNSLTDESKWWELFQYVANKSYVRHYMNVWEYERNLTGMKNFIEKELKANSPEVLEPVV